MILTLLNKGKSSTIFILKRIYLIVKGTGYELLRFPEF
jgi:hypothetical protein